MQTNVITYNLKERGRQYRGKERHFNIRAIVAAINGPACQERVRNRDMQGYYGHWPRIKFGLNPAEGGLDGGKPAPRRTGPRHHVAARARRRHHRAPAEFLDTDSGQVASCMPAAPAAFVQAHQTLPRVLRLRLCA